MRMVLFHAVDPTTAARELRVAQVTRHKALRPDHYAFIESFCAAPGCDCGLALIRDSGESHGYVATISHTLVPGTVPAGQPRTFLDPGHPQRPGAAAVLDLFSQMIANPGFAERLSRHHRLVRDAVNDPAHPVHRLMEQGHLGTIRRDRPRTGRNDPCPCGSGRKWKRCCSGDEPQGSPPAGGRP